MDIRKTSSKKGLLNIGMDCPRRWWSHLLGSVQEKTCMWHLVPSLLEKTVFGQRLDSIVLEALSTLTDSVTL